MLVREKECMDHLFKKLRRFAQLGVPNVVYFMVSLIKQCPCLLQFTNDLLPLPHQSNYRKKEKPLITDIFPIHIAA